MCDHFIHAMLCFCPVELTMILVQVDVDDVRVDIIKAVVDFVGILLLNPINYVHHGLVKLRLLAFLFVSSVHTLVGVQLSLLILSHDHNRLF